MYSFEVIVFSAVYPCYVNSYLVLKRPLRTSLFQVLKALRQLSYVTASKLGHGPDSRLSMLCSAWFKASGESFPGTGKLHGVDSYVTDIALNCPIWYAVKVCERPTGWHCGSISCTHSCKRLIFETLIYIEGEGHYPVPMSVGRPSSGLPLKKKPPRYRLNIEQRRYTWYQACSRISILIKSLHIPRQGKKSIYTIRCNTAAWPGYLRISWPFNVCIPADILCHLSHPLTPNPKMSCNRLVVNDRPYRFTPIVPPISFGVENYSEGVPSTRGIPLEHLKVTIFIRWNMSKGSSKKVSVSEPI